MASPPEAPARILIADDNHDVRDFLRETLREEGYDAVAVSSAGEALAAAVDARFDIVILDMMLPDGGGPQLIAQLRERAPRLKMVVVSGQAGCLEHRRLADLGVSRVLGKPFKTTQLLQALDVLTGDAEPPGNALKGRDLGRALRENGLAI
jgi:CheY-like chemotaxis protein